MVVMPQQEATRWRKGLAFALIAPAPTTQPVCAQSRLRPCGMKLKNVSPITNEEGKFALCAKLQIIVLSTTGMPRWIMQPNQEPQG